MQTLNEFQAKSCSQFIKRLYEFRKGLDDSSIDEEINSLHRSFLVLCNSLEIPRNAQQEEEIAELVDKENEIKKVKVGNIVFSLFEDLVIDVDERHSELSKGFVNRSFGDILEHALMLRDYEERPCDACGEYFCEPYFSTPVRRIKMKDFVAVLHEQCSLMEEI